MSGLTGSRQVIALFGSQRVHVYLRDATEYSARISCAAITIFFRSGTTSWVVIENSKSLGMVTPPAIVTEIVAEMITLGLGNVRVTRRFLASGRTPR